MKVWMPDGSIQDIDPDQIVINDLTKAPVLDGIPEGEYYIPAIVMADGGLMRIVKLKKSALATAAYINKLIDEYAKDRPNLIYIGETSLTYTATLAIGAGTRTITKTGLTGVKAADKLITFLKPGTSLATGYSLGNAVAKADETADFPVTYPALAISGSFNIPIIVYAVRFP